MWERVSNHLKEGEERFLADGSRLAESYHVCAAAGLSREIGRPRDMLSGADLTEFLGLNATLIHHARDLFTDTHRQVADKSYVFILTDGTATILHVFTTPEVLEQCWRMGIRAGTSLREESSGTNAVALALRYRQPAIVRGQQHFCCLFQDWLCVASPVIGVGGEPAACVDVSTGAKADLGFLLPVVTFLAKAVEQWLAGASRQQAVSEVAAALRNPAPASAVPTLWPDLTRQESIVACLRAQGLTEGEIASHLSVSVNTVKSHLKSVHQKLGGRSRRELRDKFCSAFPEPTPPPGHPENHPT